MLTGGLIELLWLSFRSGPELPGNQAKRQTARYQKGRSMVSSSRERKLFMIKMTITSLTPTVCQVFYQERVYYDLELQQPYGKNPFEEVVFREVK